MTLLARDEIDIVDSWLAFHLNAGADFVVATDNRSEDGTTEVLERYARDGPRPPDPRAGRGPPPGRVGDANGAPRGDRVRRRLGDQLRRGRVLVAARSVAVARCSRRCRRATARSERSCASSARPRREPFAERMTVRFSALAPINDPARCTSRSARSCIAGIPRSGSRAATTRWWTARSLRCAAGFRSSASTSRCVRPPSASTRRGCRGGLREAHRETADRVPRGHVRGAAERPDRRVLRGARRLRRGARARGRQGPAGRRHAAARRAAGSSRAGETPARSRCRHSSRTPSTPSRRRCSARRTWYGSSGGWTARARLQTVEQRLPRRVYRKLTRTAKRVLG